VSCGLVGGCIVTSAEEFPEETQVPPVVLFTPDLPGGSTIAYDESKENGLRLGITVSDANVDDKLVISARLSVVGQQMVDFVCPENTVMLSGQPERPQFDLVIDRSKIKQGACTLVEVAVSSRFLDACPTESDRAPLFGAPFIDGDVARTQYSIWEMSGDPASNPGAAKAILTSCRTVTRAPTTSMTTMVQ
jgi:hypothetical protein